MAKVNKLKTYRNRLVVALSLGIVIALVYSVRPDLFTDITSQFHDNELHLKVGPGIEMTAVEVYWSSPDSKDSVVVFSEGQRGKENFGKQGINKFEVYYQEKLIGIYKHFIKDEDQTFKFLFWVGKGTDGELTLEATAKAFGQEE